MSKLRHGLLLTALLAFAACGNGSWGPAHYVSAREVPPTAIDAPPAVGSPAYNVGMRQVIVAQASATKADKVAIRNEDHMDPEMMLRPTLGRNYTAACYPATYTLLNNAFGDAIHISNNAEDHWGTKRPWTNASVHAYAPVIDRPGYPSGHATVSYVWADILSSLFPSKAGAFNERASVIAHHRVEAGAHFPYDVSAGKQLAAIIYGKMEHSAAYRQDLTAARVEIKGNRKGCGGQGFTPVKTRASVAQH